MKENLISKIQHFYKEHVSLGLKSIFGSGCRFYPSCSVYAKESIEKYGLFYGGWKSLKRFLKCNPLGPFGYDPVK